MDRGGPRGTGGGLPRLARRAAVCGSTCSTASPPSITCRPIPKRKIEGEPRIEVLYHVSSMVHRHRLVLKVILPRWKDGVEGQLPEVSTVSGVWSTADWHEREVYDLSGVRFLGHPDLRRILCPEDWARASAAQGLRDAAGISRDPGEVNSMVMERVDPELVEFDVRTDEMLVNMGPQHPSTHGVLRLVLRTDGEVVSEVDPAHRLPAPLRREDRREPHAAPVDSLHRPDGLSGRDEHESRLGPDGREAAEARSAGKGPAPARDHRRAEPHRQPPGRGRDLRPGPRHLHPVHVLLPRAGKDPRPVRASLRRPADLQLPHRRRRDGRPAARLAPEVRASSSTSSSR